MKKGNVKEKNPVPKIGEIYIMYFNGIKNEQSGWRPGLVFQNNTGNRKSPNIIALPLTSSIKKLNMPTHVLLKSEESNLKVDSIVLCENPEKMSKEKMGKYITTLSDEQIGQVVKGSLLATSAISFLDKDTLVEIWEQALKLNSIDIGGNGKCTMSKGKKIS